MAKIIGNTTATPNPQPDWNQTDSTKADYIKNKSMIEDRVVTLEELPLTRGEVEISLEMGASAHAISNGDVAFGSNSFAGCRGYYWSNIDFTNKYIYLSTSQSTQITPTNFTWAVGDKVTITNNAIYIECSAITAIDKSNGIRLTVDSLPFTAIASPTELNIEDKSIYVPEKPNSGEVNFGYYSYAFGCENIVTGNRSVALGYKNKVYGRYAGTIGSQNKVGHFGVALNHKNTVLGTSGFASGTDNTVTGDYSTAMVYGNDVSGDYSAAIGVQNTVSGTRDFVSGSKNTVTKDYALVGGNGNTVEGSYTLTTGQNNVVEGNFAAATGYGNNITGNGGVAQGGSNTVSGRYANAINSNNTASGEYSSAKGYNTQATAQCAESQGNATLASHVNSSAHGLGTKTGVDNQFVVGKYNTVTEGALFVVGNGTSDTNRKNAFTVLSSGRASVYTAPNGKFDEHVVNYGYLRDYTSEKYAPKASPTFTGTPKAPTASSDTNSTQIATTAFVQTAANSKVSKHNTSTSAHNDIRALITDLTTKLNNFLDVDDATTDQLSEVITLINNNKGTLESLTTSKINVSDIINNLTTNSTDKVLSASQGVVIQTQLDELSSEIAELKASVVTVHSGTLADMTTSVGSDGDIYLVTE